MYYYNDGSGTENVLQNQFTAYLLKAAQNARKKYVYKKIRCFQREVLLDEYEYLSDMRASDSIDLLVDTDALLAALRTITDRERYVLLARVIEEKSFESIAAELGLTYKGAAAVYYRTIAKLKRILEG